jgi:hypothetical protein
MENATWNVNRKRGATENPSQDNFQGVVIEIAKSNIVYREAKLVR